MVICSVVSRDRQLSPSHQLRDMDGDILNSPDRLVGGACPSILRKHVSKVPGLYLALELDPHLD
jgi:hypothetical protein